MHSSAMTRLSKDVGGPEMLTKAHPRRLLLPQHCCWEVSKASPVAEDVRHPRPLSTCESNPSLSKVPTVRLSGWGLLSTKSQNMTFKLASAQSLGQADFVKGKVRM